MPSNQRDRRHPAAALFRAVKNGENGGRAPRCMSPATYSGFFLESSAAAAKPAAATSMIAASPHSTVV